MTTFDQPTEIIQHALKTYPAPFYLYDAKKIIENSNRLTRSMEDAGNRNFKNYFAVKALPNPHVLKVLKNIGQGFDCSSLAELELAHMIGATSSDIMLTSNNTCGHEFKRAHELNAIINFDDEPFVDYYLETFGPPEVASCRFNPGEIRDLADLNQKIIGKPAESKFGMSREKMIRSYQKLKQSGVTKFGLHTMLLSNNLNWQNHAEIARIMFDLADDISRELEIEFDFINLGGGIGVEYCPDDAPFDYMQYAAAVRTAYVDEGLEELGSPQIVMENGRCITASAGWLVTKVQNVKDSYKTYIGLHASMADLMRPGMYGAYHHLSLLDDDGSRDTQVVDVVGSLCENNDKFAVDRLLPVVRKGDILVIHTVGAHGHAMGFNYNGRVRPAEILARDGELTLIRRAETLDDLFRTIVPLDGETS